MRNDSKPTVLVAMSGGVDSSTAALLLKQKGYNVFGITMKLWDYQEGERKDGHCCSLEASNDARFICHHLGIPHYTLDLREDFKREVIFNFVEEYHRGRTPNPCILCNTEIKWKSLLDKAKKLEADFLATGHYARIQYDEKRKRYVLKKGIDKTRDQAYALWGLSQENLSQTLLPLGELTKKEVRKIAKKNNLKVADKEESQEICFIPDDDYENFIRNWEKKKEIPKGDIINLKGEKIAEHKGIPFYTIGQRKGLGIQNEKPLYVVNINAQKNLICVAEEKELYRSSFLVRDLNWIAIEKLDEPSKCQIKIRYLHQPADGWIYPLRENMVNVKFDKPQKAITPGQSAVFYENDVVLGGGVIDSVE
jgi:tRNA-specific 2-thiouridylase